MKFIYFVKAKKFDENSILFLTLLSNVKTTMEISSNSVAFSENLNFTATSF